MHWHRKKDHNKSVRPRDHFHGGPCSWPNRRGKQHYGEVLGFIFRDPKLIEIIQLWGMRHLRDAQDAWQRPPGHQPLDRPGGLSVWSRSWILRHGKRETWTYCYNLKGGWKGESWEHITRQNEWLTLIQFMVERGEIMVLKVKQMYLFQFYLFFVRAQSRRGENDFAKELTFKWANAFWFETWIMHNVENYFGRRRAEISGSKKNCPILCQASYVATQTPRQCTLAEAFSRR